VSRPDAKLLLRASRVAAAALSFGIVAAGLAASRGLPVVHPPRLAEGALAVVLLAAALAAGRGPWGALALAGAWGALAGVMGARLVDPLTASGYPPELAASALLVAAAGVGLALGAGLRGVAALGAGAGAGPALPAAGTTEPAAAGTPEVGAAGPLSIQDYEAQIGVLSTRAALAAEALDRANEEQERLREEIRRLQDHDPLTGLPGRRLFLDRLTVALIHAARQRQKLAVLMLAVDGLPAVQEALGHGAAEDLMRSVAAVLEQTLRQGDTVSRAAGEEYTVLLPGLHRSEDAIRVVEKIRLALVSPITLSGNDVLATASIGIAVYPEDGPDSETLLDSARTAMVAVRARGGDGWELHAPSSSAAASERRILERALRRALVENDLLLHYQPIVDAATGRVARAEAFLRWRNADKRLVTAGDFMGLADDSGLSVPLGQWAIQRACMQAREWQSAEPGLAVAVNLLSRQFDHPALTRLVGRALKESGLPPACLHLEVPEPVLLRNLQSSVARLWALRDLGVRIAVSNFGLGHASVGQIQKCPLDGLKIDRSVVQGILTDPDLEAVVSATIAMARGLRLEVVAEGVESEAQRSLLAGWQCTHLQGNLFGAPVTAEEFERALARRRAVPVSAGSDGEPPPAD
jgi:diguanylate cyclase (GGDEF)-like protein